MALWVDKNGKIQSKDMLTDAEMKRLQESLNRRKRERENRMKLEASMRRKEEKARQKMLRSQLLQFKRVRNAAVSTMASESTQAMPASIGRNEPVAAMMEPQTNAEIDPASVAAIETRE